MTTNPHLFWRNQRDGAVNHKIPVRDFGSEKQEIIEEEKEYTPKADEFKSSFENFVLKRMERIRERNNSLRIPKHLNSIEITFHDTFDASKYELRYRKEFGLTAVAYYDFNSRALFAIVDENQFKKFLRDVLNFYRNIFEQKSFEFNRLILFIKNFRCHSTDLIIKSLEIKENVILNIFNGVEIEAPYVDPIRAALISYLFDNGITFYNNPELKIIQLVKVSNNILEEIVQNFDIIQEVNSFSGGIIKPNAYNVPERSYGFEIINADEDLPIIGVIDTGISAETPLKGLLVNSDNNYDLTGTSPLIDNVDHGTAVACFAALGDRLNTRFDTELEADAKLLSIKILDTQSGIIPECAVIEKIKEAHQQYGIKIFTLTIGYELHKNYNARIEKYAYALDVLAYELDILIFISIGNNWNLSDFDGRKFVSKKYPKYYDDEETNLKTPAESMNNVTVGAAAGNFGDHNPLCLSLEVFFPAPFTRTHYINWQHSTIKKSIINKHLFKPDILHFGGNCDHNIDPSMSGLKTISSRQGLFYELSIGTSYATPLAANLAAKILKLYPGLRDNMQTVKALIINSAHLQKIQNYFSGLENLKMQSICGNGIPATQSLLFSNENDVTFILEDKIQEKQIQTYSLSLPTYLLSTNKKKGVLHVDATLCFKFMPIADNHLAYCPIHITFGVFRNLPLEDNIIGENGAVKSTGINNNKNSEYKFAESWAQDYYYKSKMLANCQKMSFNITKKSLIEEHCQLKIAIQSHVHKLLSRVHAQPYLGEHNFSLVMRIFEIPTGNKQSGRLYDEVSALNNLQIINEIDRLDLELS